MKSVVSPRKKVWGFRTLLVNDFVHNAAILSAARCAQLLTVMTYAKQLSRTQSARFSFRVYPGQSQLVPRFCDAGHEPWRSGHSVCSTRGSNRPTSDFFGCGLICETLPQLDLFLPRPSLLVILSSCAHRPVPVLWPGACTC